MTLDRTHLPIGVFDSGVGGLSVLRAIRRELPGEHLVYAADSKFVPYGDKTDDAITARASAMTAFLISQGAKVVVVACNTATGIAVDTLRARYALPIIGMEPAVKPAAALTRSGVVGVLATTRTLSSAKFSRLMDAHAGRARVLLQACPGLVERVEAGDLSSEATRALVRQYVGALVEKNADTIVLGCTHYAFLAEAIQEVAGRQATLVDSAAPVAKELRRRLEHHNLLEHHDRLEHHDLVAAGSAGGADEFWATDASARVGRVISELWGADVAVREVPTDSVR